MTSLVAKRSCPATLILIVVTSGVHHNDAIMNHAKFERIAAVLRGLHV